MPVSASDIKLLRSQVVNDGLTNGGRLSYTAIASGVINNLFTRAGEDERTAGSLKYRKAFLANRNAANDKAYGLDAYIENYTPGDDEILFFIGTQTDTQNDITGSEDLYGCGQLNTDITATDTSIVVDVHDWANYPIFRNGGLIRISDKPTYDGVGNTEYIRIHASTPITAVGNTVTIPLENPIAGNYTAAATRVAAVYEGGDLEPTVDNWSETSAAGTFDEATYPVTGDNKGTIEQTWTITFTDATNFTVAGDLVGSIGAGTIGANFAPNNPDTGTPYFTLNYLGFGGTWQAGDSIVFSTHPAALPLWFLRQIPAGAAAYAADTAVIAFRAGA